MLVRGSHTSAHPHSHQLGQHITSARPARHMAGFSPHASSRSLAGLVPPGASSLPDFYFQPPACLRAKPQLPPAAALPDGPAAASPPPPCSAPTRRHSLVPLSSSTDPLHHGSYGSCREHCCRGRGTSRQGERLDLAFLGSWLHIEPSACEPGQPAASCSIRGVGCRETQSSTAGATLASRGMLQHSEAPAPASTSWHPVSSGGRHPSPRWVPTPGTWQNTRQPRG